MGTLAQRAWAIYRRGIQGWYGCAQVTVSKTALTKMDALASDTHIGLIYAENPDGTDQIIERIPQRTMIRQRHGAWTSKSVARDT